MTSVISNLNNTNQPILALQTFGGKFELVNAYTALSFAITTDTNCLITVYQSYDGVSLDSVSAYASVAGVFFSKQINLLYKYCRISVFNPTGVAQTYISFMTRWMSVIPLPLETSNVVVVGGSISLAPSSNTIGNVGVNNLITQTLAIRRVDFLVVGVWYRVASVGLTTGSEWNAIGAIVDGESEPVIGRLFKCLSIGPAVAGGGECYDVEYTTDINCNITNIPAIQPVSGTVSLTDPTTVRIRDTYGDPITTTAGNLMVGINNIYTANPLHTIVDSGTVNTKAPDSFSVRVSTASSTGVQVSTGGHLLNFLAVNLSAVADAYIKLYDSVSAPSPASDVPFMIAHVSRDAAARLPSIQVDTSNLKITNKLWVRAVTGSADTNTDVTGLTVDICFFGTST